MSKEHKKRGRLLHQKATTNYNTTSISECCKEELFENLMSTRIACFNDIYLTIVNKQD
jgi:hypothetical protein